MNNEKMNRAVSEAIEPLSSLPEVSENDGYSPEEAWFYRHGIGWHPRSWERSLGAIMRLKRLMASRFYSQMVRRDGENFRAACGDNTLQWTVESGPMPSEGLAVRQCAALILGVNQ